MSTINALRLSETIDQPEDILPFERRLSERHHMQGQATAVRAGGQPGSGTLRKISSLDLVNISDTGLGAMCSEPVEVDIPITVFFQAHGPEGGHDAHGQVVRCERTPQGHDIGIRFDTRSAA